MRWHTFVVTVTDADDGLSIHSRRKAWLGLVDDRLGMRLLPLPRVRVEFGFIWGWGTLILVHPEHILIVVRRPPAFSVSEILWVPPGSLLGGDGIPVHRPWASPGGTAFRTLVTLPPPVPVPIPTPPPAVTLSPLFILCLILRPPASNAANP